MPNIEPWKNISFTPLVKFENVMVAKLEIDQINFLKNLRKITMFLIFKLDLH